MKARIRGWQRCDCAGGQRDGAICLRCAGSGYAPAWRRELEGGGVVLDFARTLNPSGGAMGDALPFSLTPQASRAADAAPRSLFEKGTAENEDN